MPYAWVPRLFFSLRSLFISFSGKIWTNILYFANFSFIIPAKCYSNILEIFDTHNHPNIGTLVFIINLKHICSFICHYMNKNVKIQYRNGRFPLPSIACSWRFQAPEMRCYFTHQLTHPTQFGIILSSLLGFCL